jgi:outer membrane murein-binding lipoprotein Lpp
MKNNVILAGLVAAMLVLAGCSSYCKTPCNETAPCPAHHDLKGEVGSK